METVELVCDPWRSGPVRVAASFTERLRGIHGVAPDEGILLPLRSVHGFTRRAPLWVVGLDRSLTVIGVTMLRRGRLVGWRRASQVLELPAWREAPVSGWSLRISSLPVWPAP